MKRILFATTNKGKLDEAKAIMGGKGVEVLSLADVAVDVDIVEDGETFEENAVKKAVGYAGASGMPALCDDSGIEIDYLDKRPGVLSARFLGADTPYSYKNQEIIRMLENAPDDRRTARFVSVIAFCGGDGNVLTARGVIEGEIAKEIRGANGFGYDPIFFLKDRGVCMAELPPEEKNAISHRGRALRAMYELLIEKGII